MKKFNYLLIVFAVVFTAGFSSCGGDEEVAPREEKLTSEQITELLNGNVYDGEIFLGDETELREISISFIEDGEFNVDMSGAGGISTMARGWEIQNDNEVLIKRVNNTSRDFVYMTIETIDQNGFTFIRSDFNDGEPVRVTKR